MSEQKKKLSRRDFLKGAAGAAGIAALGVLAGCKQEEPAPSAQPSAAGEKIYTPGTYTASAKGMESDVTVTIEVDETKILSATVDTAGETEGLGKPVGEKMAQEILEKQSIEVEGVSGATVTSKAAKAALEDCIAQAKGIDVSLIRGEGSKAEKDSADWLGQAPEIKDSEVVKTVDTEVLVIGAGTAGLFAACAAVEEGAKTILIEKFGEDYGGSGVRDTIAAVGSKQQIENKDDPDKFDVITEMYRQSNGYGDQRLYKVWADYSGETVDWYTQRMAEAGYRFLHEVDDHSHAVRYPIFDVGHSIQFSDLGDDYEGKTAKALKEYAKGLGLEIHYDTSLVELIKEGEKVTGIYAKTGDGYVRYNAAKGVIVCTGGYSLNMDMLNALQPETVKMININYSYPGSQGDGIKACLWAGAAMDESHASMLFDRGGIKADQVGCAEEGVLFWMGSQPFLKVGLDGKRFTNESGCYDHILHDAFNLPGMTYAMVWDADYIKDMERFDSHGCSRMFPHANGAEAVWPLEFNEGVFMPMYREQGIVVTADTIEELAEKLGLPVDTFKATVDRYNELYDMQKDEDFGKEPYRLSQLRKAPFEGVRMSGGYFICTLDGIKIDENMNALTPEGKPIEGLYVAGDCSGGYFDASYPNLLAGCAAGRSVTFGRRAGKLAAKR
mgnify:CR=1 FL=1